jgi:hypothetical protein
LLKIDSHCPHEKLADNKKYGKSHILIVNRAHCEKHDVNFAAFNYDVDIAEAPEYIAMQTKQGNSKVSNRKTVSIYVI